MYRLWGGGVDKTVCLCCVWHRWSKPNNLFSDGDGKLVLMQNGMNQVPHC